MFKYLGAATAVAMSAGAAFASGGIVECVPLGNLLDDPKGTSLVSAIASDTYGAGASVHDLGVNRIVKGGLNAAALITPSLTFNASNIGGGSAVPGALPNNDRVYTGGSSPISSIGSLVLPMPSNKVEDGIGLWGDMVISFDLNEIRHAGGMNETQDFVFMARGGINDYAPETASLRVAVIVSNASGVLSAWVNGELVDVEENGGVWSVTGYVPEALSGSGQRLTNFLVPIPGDATQISLMSLSLDDGNSGDQAIFADAKLSTVPVPAPATFAVLGCGLIFNARRRRA